MEQVRLILAVVLSILVFLIWDFFFVPKTPPNMVPGQTIQKVRPATSPEGEPKEAQREATTPAVRPDTKTPGIISTAEQTPAEQTETGLPLDQGEAAELVTVETPLYTAVFSEQGGLITDFTLKTYREEKGPEAPLKQLVSDKNPLGLLGFDLEGAGLSGLTNGYYKKAYSSDVLYVDDSSQTLVFSRTLNNGVVVEKHYRFVPDSYMIILEVVVKNGSDQALTGNPGVFLSKHFPGDGGRFVFEGPSAFANQHLTEVKLKDIEETGTVSGPLDWIAIQSRYFMSAVVPESTEPSLMRLTSFPDDDGAIVRATYVGPTATILPGTAQNFIVKSFIGPKRIPVLKKAGNNLDKAVNFGWFDVVARPCLWLMNFIYRFIPNYGVAIIIVTLIIKLIFWPLGNKSYKSMGEMKKLQPLMAEIREKYKDDKKKMNEEMMGLYKTYKINPLGGCLPMVVQIPVFIAFYRMLYQSIELRHASFMLWINDLSAPERLFSFNATIPFMQPPVGIPVMTIIMGATMFLQQKLQPAPGDPAQAKIMMLMPIMLTVIFINFPSGLVLYFIVNNLISIAQQQYITKKNA